MKLIQLKKCDLVTSDEQIATTFKNYFDEIVPKLNIIQNDCHM